MDNEPIDVNSANASSNELVNDSDHVTTETHKSDRNELISSQVKFLNDVSNEQDRKALQDEAKELDELILAHQRAKYESEEYSQSMIESNILKKRLELLISHKRDGILTDREFVSIVAPLIGVELDEQGKVILYHATPSTNISAVLENGLQPRSATGNYSWSTHSELDLEDSENARKAAKIYLGKKSSIEGIAKNVGGRQGNGVYIFKVHADFDKLREDEDMSPYYRVLENDEWPLTLFPANGTCSYEGSFLQPELVAKIKPGLSQEEVATFSRLLGNGTDVERSRAIAYGDGVIKSREEQENAILIQHGIEPTFLTNGNFFKN